MSEPTTIVIPTPLVRPLSWPVDKAEVVHEAWDAFVTNDPATKAELPQSGEMRILMAILRSVHDGLHDITPCTVCPPNPANPSEEKNNG